MNDFDIKYIMVFETLFSPLSSYMCNPHNQRN